ncbi:MAG: hypothetical protein K0R90_1262 [Oscillospiraceae bacterium]|jgi:hypothetical protein|nr:hypothetical protein [Oscillospiraceae bacterium]
MQFLFGMLMECLEEILGKVFASKKISRIIKFILFLLLIMPIDVLCIYITVDSFLKDLLVFIVTLLILLFFLYLTGVGIYKFIKDKSV